MRKGFALILFFLISCTVTSQKGVKIGYIDTEYILVLDCDLQHDINSIPIMIDSLNNHNYDLVIGCRNINKINQINRRYMSFFGILLTKLTGIPKLKDPLSGFFGLKTF